MSHENARLKREIQRLEKENAELKSLIEKSNEKKEFVTQISRQKINQFVDEEIMKNQSVNSPYIPDLMEKQLYRNVINVALGVIESVITTTNISVLGHTIELDIKPKENKK